MTILEPHQHRGMPSFSSVRSSGGGRRRYLAGLAHALTILVLSNCGGGDTSLVSSQGASTGASPTSPPLALGGASATGGVANAPRAGSGATASQAGSASAPPASKECRGVTFDAAATDGGASGAEACAGVSVEAEAVPVDIYVMMDRSVSMNEPVAGGTQTRWEALREALERFTSAAKDRDLRVGIGFFGKSGARDDAIDCDPAQYEVPRVEVGRIAEVAPRLVDAMRATAPGGLTPTLPALRGALNHAREWARSNPGRATSVVLVTDGFPTQCQDPISLPAIAEEAAAARNEAPFVRTFVIGLAAGFNLDSLARAGGTEHAYLVDEGDVASSFATALGNISDSALDCEYELPEPPGGDLELDYERVQLLYTPAVGEVEEVPRVLGAEACGRNPNGGWYFDSVSSPSKISVCPCTCTHLGAGRVDVRLGCVPYIGLR
jgi:von Willebrand factor type A domain